MATIKHPTTKSVGDKLYAVADWNANHTAVISHTELTDKGTNTHANIDTHIANSNIHPDNTTLVHKTGNESIAGVKTFTSFPVTPSSSPTSEYQVANKFYVDSFLTGLTWKAPVATYDDLATTYPTPSAGWAVLVLDENKGYVWDGSAWVQFTAVQEYTASNGVVKVGNDFQIDIADTNPSLEVADGGVRVQVDDSTIRRTAIGLQVKDGGITNDKLAGSITDSKLNKIETAGKVSGSALTELDLIPAGALQVPVANLGVGAPTADTFLRGDGNWAEPPAGAYYGVTSYTDYDIISSPQTDQTWTNMPSALNELFQNNRGRVQADLSNASRYRLVVNQSAEGASGADINLQYSLNRVDWFPCDTASAGELDVGLIVGVKVGEWADLVVGAKQDVLLRIVGKGGNGIADPAWRQMRIQFEIPAAETPPILAEHAIEFVMDGGGEVISSGDRGDVEIPFDCEIQSATLLADRKGDIKVDIWVNGYANYPPTNGDTITNGNEPELVGDDKYQDNILTDWTTALTKGQTMRMHVDSCNTIQRCTLSLKVNKT